MSKPPHLSSSIPFPSSLSISLSHHKKLSNLRVCLTALRSLFVLVYEVTFCLFLSRSLFPTLLCDLYVLDYTLYQKGYTLWVTDLVVYRKGGFFQVFLRKYRFFNWILRLGCILLVGFAYVGFLPFLDLLLFYLFAYLLSISLRFTLLFGPFWI